MSNNIDEKVKFKTLSNGCLTIDNESECDGLDTKGFGGNQHRCKTCNRAFYAQQNDQCYGAYECYMCQQHREKR